MRPIRFNASNAIFGAPEDWDPATQGECEAIHGVTDGRRVTTVWALEPEDLERIRKGANVLLTCVGVQPPVWLEVADPALAAYHESGEPSAAEALAALGAMKTEGSA